MSEVTDPNAMSLTVDGIIVTPQTITVSESGGEIYAVGSVDDYTRYTISANETITPGTYSLDNNSQFEVSHTSDNQLTFYYSSAGSVTVITHDTLNNKITGTFNCTLTHINEEPSKTVTNGSFSVNY